jgi:Protein of unknown function (DUF2934)
MGTVRKGGGRGSRGAKASQVRKTGTGNGSNGTAMHIAAAQGDSVFHAVRMRAYELFLERGATHGNDLADWFKAEQELLSAQRL